MQTDSSHRDSGTNGEVTGYRPVSALAILAAAAGAVSAVALASPLFWTVPLLAIGLAVVALRDVAGAENDSDPESVRLPGDRKLGRWWVLAGLALAIGFGAQAVTTHLVHRWISSDRAVAAARLWVETVLEDRLGDAAKSCLPMVIPPSPGAGSRGFTMPDAPSQVEGQFAKMEVVEAMRKCATGAPIEAHCSGPEYVMPAAWVVHVSLGPCAEGMKPVRLRLLMRSKAVTRGTRQFDTWTVAGLAFDQEG
ncbi:MAG: hypothetical protein DWH79_05060 [Planctomycetota bacterium]|nr:MAG: hypothetical protein DWH79_05060 [Planctomycetota bacterium]